MWRGYLFRESWTWEQEIKTHDGEVLKLHVEYSNTRQVGHADLFSIGGGSPRYELTIRWAKDGRVKWYGSVCPIVIDAVGASVYLVSFGQQGEDHEPAFAYYAWESGSWRDLRATELPRTIAIQNFGVGSPSKEYLVRGALRNREYLLSVDFRRSITARLWYCIENGVSYWEVRNLTVPEEFVVAYYEREILNRAAQIAPAAPSRD